LKFLVRHRDTDLFDYLDTDTAKEAGQHERKSLPEKWYFETYMPNFKIKFDPENPYWCPYTKADLFIQGKLT
jgi:triphosphoribosyl-dephospho-CoA synthetase